MTVSPLPGVRRLPELAEISHPPVRLDPRLLRVAKLLVAVVFVSAFVLSFGALYGVALAAGVDHPIAWLWPLSVDVLAVVSAIAIWTLSGSSRAPTLYAWIVLAAFLALSVWGNGLHSVLAGHVTLSHNERFIVSATPPISLGLGLHLLILMLRPKGGVDTVHDMSTPEDRTKRAEIEDALAAVDWDPSLARQLLDKRGITADPSYVHRVARGRKG